MNEGDPALPGLVAVARDQALVAAQGRVASLSSQGRVAAGRFVPDIQSIAVDGKTASLRDCYAAEIVERDRETEEEVADRSGVRFDASAELSMDDDGQWTVVEFTQGDFCVPADLADDIEGRYAAFWAAVAAAGQPADPDHPALADAAAGEQLAGLQDRLSEFRDEGYEVRDESVSHVRAVRVSHGDTAAVVRDCQELDSDGGVYDASTDELVDGGAEPGQRALWEARLELVEGTWKVVDTDVVEEDSGCDPAAF